MRHIANYETSRAKFLKIFGDLVSGGGEALSLANLRSCYRCLPRQPGKGFRDGPSASTAARRAQVKGNGE
jgi:hypothetical protein